MAGREGLVDTAVKTAETGYMSRRLMKVRARAGGLALLLLGPARWRWVRAATGPRVLPGRWAMRQGGSGGSTEHGLLMGTQHCGHMTLTPLCALPQALEDLYTHYDSTVRNAAGGIVQVRRLAAAGGRIGAWQGPGLSVRGG